MNKKLTIYFGDLTHDTIGLSTEVFPLNIGFVASYLLHKLPDEIDIKLFKFAGELESEIVKSPPDVLALSNYPWCHSLGIAMFELANNVDKNIIRVMGGPNFPHRKDLQEVYLQNRPLIDAHTYLDGEVPFFNLIEAILKVQKTERRSYLKKENILGCVHLNDSSVIEFDAVPCRLSDLDCIPSPYKTGLFDKFFSDGRLNPMIQTNRGCPFSCTFCADGSALVNKVNKFSVERVKDELTYIAEHVDSRTKTLYISDLNYGMYSRDKEISQHMAEIRDKYNYPLYIDISTGKNSRHRVIENIEILNGALNLSMSVQSMDAKVLKFIKRDNLKLEDYTGVMPAITSSGLSTTSEVILGLPSETKESHIKSLTDLIDLGVDNVFAYTLMLLHGSELYTPEEMKKWEYETKFRVIPRDFTWVSALDRGVIEVEEVAVASNTLTFEDYIYCRKFVLLVNLVTQDGYKAINKWLRNHGISSRLIITRVLDIIESAIDDQVTDEGLLSLAEIFCDYESFTRDELWNSEEEVHDFYATESNFKKLVSGEAGINCLQTFRAKVWASNFDALTKVYFSVIEGLVNLNDEQSVEEFENIKKYCVAKTSDIFSIEREHANPLVFLRYDIKSWLLDLSTSKLAKFKFDTPVQYSFELTSSQFETLEKALELYGRDSISLGKVLIRIPVNTLYRNPRPVDNKLEHNNGKIESEWSTKSTLSYQLRI
jgi:radical SAM superfamily enzyme YgiQ (UPF0313 family)